MNHITTATASMLNKLIEVNRDSFFAYQEAESHIESVELRGYFNVVSQERLRFGQELLFELFKTDGEIGDGLNAAERPLPWRTIKGHFIAQNNRFILRELERLESWALKRYDRALNADLTPELRALIERQAADCHRIYQHIHTQREALPQKQRAPGRALAPPSKTPVAQ